MFLKNQQVLEDLPQHYVFTDGRSTGDFREMDSSIHIAEGFIPFEEIKPEYNADTQTLEQGEIVISGDGKSASRTWVARNKTSGELWSAVRTNRNMLLAQCDWTQLKDAAEGVSSSWQPYRHALRNIPQDYESPAAVVWPTKPA